MRPEVRQASMALMDALTPKPGEEYTLRSRSKDGHEYRMIVTPDGYAVHQGLGCEGEMFSGVLGCWHAKTRTPTEEEMTTAMTPYAGTALAMRTISDEDKSVLKKTICRGASDAELDLFVATCKHTGLDPFMKQIHAVFRNTNVGTKDRPDWQPVMTIQVGVDGYRLIADRTELMEGMDGPLWSPDGKDWYDFPDPAAQFAKVAIWRKGVPRAFTAVCRLGAYAQDNHMWRTMGPEQLAKCAEVLALRRAFPAEMAALPMAVSMDEDAEAVPPLTRAEVPEGSFRELDAPTSVQAPPAPPRPAPEPRPDAPLTPTQLLNRIETAHGLPAKQEAIKVMTRLFGTGVVTKLDDDQRAEYVDILSFRLAGTAHEHDEAFTASMVRICRLCGAALEDEAGVESPEPVAAGLGI